MGFLGWRRGRKGGGEAHRRGVDLATVALIHQRAGQVPVGNMWGPQACGAHTQTLPQTWDFPVTLGYPIRMCLVREG